MAGQSWRRGAVWDAQESCVLKVSWWALGIIHVLKELNGAWLWWAEQIEQARCALARASLEYFLTLFNIFQFWRVPMQSLYSLQIEMANCHLLSRPTQLRLDGFTMSVCFHCTRRCTSGSCKNESLHNRCRLFRTMYWNLFSCWHVKTLTLKLYPRRSSHLYSTHQHTSPLPCLRMQPFEPSRTVALSRMLQSLLAHPEDAENTSWKKRSHPFLWYSMTTKWFGYPLLWGCRVPLKEPHVCVERSIQLVHQDFSR